MLKMKANNTSWEEIAACLPGRTVTACKKQYSNVMCRNRKRLLSQSKKGSSQSKRKIDDDIDDYGHTTKTRLSHQEDSENSSAKRARGLSNTGRDSSHEPSKANISETVTSGDNWTASHDSLIRKMKENNASWKAIAACLPGRTVDACKAHYYSLIRNKSSKRSNRDVAVNGRVTGSKATLACAGASKRAHSFKDTKTGATSCRHRKKKRTEMPPRWTEEDRRLVQASYLSSCPRWHL